MNDKAAQVAEDLRKQWTGPMTEAETAFLKDVQGFIAFALRNGLTFPMVASALAHDINEVARDGFDYEKTRSRGLPLKVAGYSDVACEDFGMSDEEEPAH
jgi:hypothetical protein